METTDPDRTQASGYNGDLVGHGDGLHTREELLIEDLLTSTKRALVIRCYAEFWITTVEPWED